jgi:Tfp pilus assembly protein PilF
MRRPLVCKIHRDLLLGPKNDPRSLKRLHEAWAATLRSLFARYTPIFIGYGGNDDSLMDLLESLDPGEIKGQMIWCYYDRGETPNERIRKLIVQHRGALVPVPDFDLLMVLLGDKMGILPPDNLLEERAQTRAARYRERILGLDTTGYPQVVTALAATYDRAGQGWWAWELKARAETDNQKREDIYHQGIQEFPNSWELHGNFALFMAYIRKNPDEAELLYRQALVLNPHDANHTGNFANFMAEVRKNPDEAERLYRKALELDAKHANNTGNFANFMANVRKNPDEAEHLYRQALAIDPQHAANAGNFAVFMDHVRKDPAEAERLYRQALELDPQHSNNMGNFGGFLVGHGRTDEALLLLERAWTLNLSKPDQSSAEVVLYMGIIARCAGRDDSQELGRLKTLLLGGFIRLPWSFDAVLAFAIEKLSGDDFAFYAALADAILDADRVTALDTLERWLSVTPIPLDQLGATKAV